MTLKVYNILGQPVAAMVDGELKAGVLHRAIFDAKYLSSGIYFYKLQADGKTMVKRLMLMK